MSCTGTQAMGAQRSLEDSVLPTMETAHCCHTLQEALIATADAALGGMG